MEKSVNEIFTIQFHQSKYSVPENNYLYFYMPIIWEVWEGAFKKVIPSEKGKDSKWLVVFKSQMEKQQQNFNKEKKKADVRGLEWKRWRN